MKTIIKNEESKSINWSLIQIYVCTEDDTYVLSTGIHDASTFEGIALPNEENPAGEFSRLWSKSAFKLFDGSVTMTN